MKVIQIIKGLNRGELLALCDDGSIWSRNDYGNWTELDIPKRKKKEKKNDLR